jgi:exodeoxyribonuclease-3
MPRVLELLAQHAPDVACLQETKCPPDGFPELELLTAGYSVVHNSGGQWAGVALLARTGLDLENAVLGLPGEPQPPEARWVEATVAGIRFASTYVPNGRALDSPEYPRKLAFLESVRDRVTALDSAPVVVAGDFNVTPADEDVYDPAQFVGGTHVTGEERSRLRAIGLRDAYRLVHPDVQQFTWWDYRAGHFHKGLGLRIDLALVSESVRVTECGIDRNYRKGSKPSDHAPLLVEISA